MDAMTSERNVRGKRGYPFPHPTIFGVASSRAPFFSNANSHHVRAKLPSFEIPRNRARPLGLDMPNVLY